MTASGSVDLFQILFFGDQANRTEVYSLRGGEWKADVVGPSSEPDSAREARFVAIEVEDTCCVPEHFDSRRTDLQENGFRGCYFVLPDRLGADVVSQLLIERSLGPFKLFGIDPDYYHGIVPLTGDHHRRIEAFVLGLKPTTDFPAQVKHWIKHALIRAGLSTPLYERFLIVLEEPSCS